MDQQSADHVDAKQLAGRIYREGYNVLKAIVRAFRDAMHIAISDEA